MARTPLPGSPERPKPDRYREQYGVIVVCEDEAHRASLALALLVRHALDCGAEQTVHDRTRR